MVEESDRIVREPERLRITGVSRGHWAVLESRGEVPRRILVGARSVGWSHADLMAWIAKRSEVVDTPEARRRRAPPVLSARARGIRTSAQPEHDPPADVPIPLHAGRRK
jgi:predicted DNA-binding transcriptional regulator AlpA